MQAGARKPKIRVGPNRRSVANSPFYWPGHTHKCVWPYFQDQKRQSEALVDTHELLAFLGKRQVRQKQEWGATNLHFEKDKSTNLKKPGGEGKANVSKRCR